MEDKDTIRLLLDSCKSWNGGYGLIVPEYVGKALKEMGFEEKDGFSISPNLLAN